MTNLGTGSVGNGPTREPCRDTDLWAKRSRQHSRGSHRECSARAFTRRLGRTGKRRTILPVPQACKEGRLKGMNAPRTRAFIEYDLACAQANILSGHHALRDGELVVE